MLEFRDLEMLNKDEKISLFVYAYINSIHTSKPNAHIQYSIQSSAAWKTVFGCTSGKTPLGKRSNAAVGGGKCVIAHPFLLSTVKLQSSPLGWPQVVLEAYTMTLDGEDYLIGYGLVRIPAVSGQQVVRVPLFLPKAQGDSLQFIHGKTPEFNNARLLAQSTSRGQIRTYSRGDYIEIEFNVAVM